MPKKVNMLKFKNFERKIKSPFMIYADFESIQMLGKKKEMLLAVMAIN